MTQRQLVDFGCNENLGFTPTRVSYLYVSREFACSEPHPSRKLAGEKIENRCEALRLRSVATLA